MCTDDGLASILEAVDIQKMHILSDFIREFADHTCWESKKCQITTVFTEYIYVLNQVCGCIGMKKWILSDVLALSRYIQELKLNGVRVLRVYRKSGIGTLNGT